MDYIGQIVGGFYRVDRFLGTGRFASVYAATRLPENRPVALKIFAPHLVKKAGGKRRFLGQSMMAGKPPHPAIVALEDRGNTKEAIPFAVMELLRGQTVQQRVEATGPLELVRCLDVATVMLEALDAIHQSGTTHRSLNPNNLFLCEPGSSELPVRLLDYGVAKDLVDHLAVSPDVIGQTRYMAPEFLLNRNMTWAPGIDVFAAGLVLFYMLTGYLPFKIDKPRSSEALKAATISLYLEIEGEHPGPAEFSRRVPQAIDAVVKKATAIKQADRYSNAGEMLAAFKEARAQIDFSTGSGGGTTLSEKPKQPTLGALLKPEPLPEFLRSWPSPLVGNRTLEDSGTWWSQPELPPPQPKIDPPVVRTEIDIHDPFDTTITQFTKEHLFQLPCPTSSADIPDPFGTLKIPTNTGDFQNLFDPTSVEGVRLSPNTMREEDQDQSTSIMTDEECRTTYGEGKVNDAATTLIDEGVREQTDKLNTIDIFSGFDENQVTTRMMSSPGQRVAPTAFLPYDLFPDPPEPQTASFFGGDLNPTISRTISGISPSRSPAPGGDYQPEIPVLNPSALRSEGTMQLRQPSPAEASLEIQQRNYEQSTFPNRDHFTEEPRQLPFQTPTPSIEYEASFVVKPTRSSIYQSTPIELSQVVEKPRKDGISKQSKLLILAIFLLSFLLLLASGILFWITTGSEINHG